MYCNLISIKKCIIGLNSGPAYLELPPESKYHMRHNCNFNDLGNLQHSISTDSLLFSDNKTDITDVEGCFEMQCHQVIILLLILSFLLFFYYFIKIAIINLIFFVDKKVFIGMVTMQYQAQIDVVQLIERLDRACIRFVHFSKENELRSRVFSEKMGLESGWNCHISLLIDENRYNYENYHIVF